MKLAMAGNICVDKIYPIPKYPAGGTLCRILDGISQSTGGAVCNTGIDLCRLLPGERIAAIGCVGHDADGDFAVEKMHAAGMDCSLVRRTEHVTAFTAVMSDRTSGERTLFTHAGANDDLTAADFPLEALEAGTLLHVGYVLLLAGLDAEDEEYGTKMARLLHDAQARGIRTSIDLVSENSERFARLVPPALKYADYIIINEIEAELATGVPLRNSAGTLLRERMPLALAKLREMGAPRLTVIHCPEGGFGTDEKGRFCAVGSVALPREEIRGKVGAGDAFCAGVLAGIHAGVTLPEAIRLGGAAAAASLTEPGATEGVVSAAEAMAFAERYGFSELK